jgi:uncharacterized repeat protein (TIGR03803 family)
MLNRTNVRGILLTMALAGAATLGAQPSFQVLHNFQPALTTGPLCVGADGALYGQTQNGDPGGGSMIYKINPDGSGYNMVYDFSGTFLLGDSSLLCSGPTLFGTWGNFAWGSQFGALFKVNQDGTGYAEVIPLNTTSPLPFSPAIPHGGVVESGGVLYGRTEAGGVYQHGVIYRVNLNGTGYQRLHDFESDGHYPRTDLYYGGHPGLVLAGTTLYGVEVDATAAYVYAIGTDGTGFTKIHTFDGIHYEIPSGLIISNGALFGTTTSSAFQSHYGAIFKMALDGTGYRELRLFNATDGYAHSALTSVNGVLYGTHGLNFAGSNFGVVYKINEDGTGFAIVHDFNGTGIYPLSSLIGVGASLYGTATVPSDGAASHDGPSLLYRVGTDGVAYAPDALGSFDTPTNGSTQVQGAIAVTGWALSDGGIDHVELWRDPVNGDPAPAANGKIFLANATFVTGSRPDVQSVHPEYPQADRAGWGYMLLTNMLPNVNTGSPVGGVGTFTIYPYVYDLGGHLTVLPAHTFTCDNAAGANKPFGTIDTPAQGAVASGPLDNFGWVLTPGTATIPTNGSTVQVFVDGNFLGNAQYNLPRSDIQTLFPGYTNSNGAIGYFPIDTTTLSNGVHTIYWVVTDDQNRTEGIGSRYFTVQN